MGCAAAAAEDSPSESSKKTVPKQIGGLLFDVDEGVDVQKGPGGSVYVKSNREYMGKKFRETEERLQSLEKRMDLMETLMQQIERQVKTAEPDTPAEKSSDKSSALSRRVLAT